MPYAAEVTARDADGRFVHFIRDADMPCAFLVHTNLPIIMERDEGYRDVRVLAVREREVFDMPAYMGEK